MDIVSFKTAKMLKDAGFPQPELDNFQFWYNDEQKIICYGETVDSWGEPDEYVRVFAPSATDILRMLLMHGCMVAIQYDTTKSGLSWVCSPLEWSMPDMETSYHETNPAEAAAEVWLRKVSAI